MFQKFSAIIFLNVVLLYCILLLYFILFYFLYNYDYNLLHFHILLSISLKVLSILPLSSSVYHSKLSLRITSLDILFSPTNLFFLTSLSYTISILFFNPTNYFFSIIIKLFDFQRLFKILFSNPLGHFFNFLFLDDISTPFLTCQTSVCTSFVQCVKVSNI